MTLRNIKCKRCGTLIRTNNRKALFCSGICEILSLPALMNPDARKVTVYL